MMMHAVISILTGSLVILCLAYGVRWLFMMRGRLGMVISVAAVSVMLSILALNGIGTEMVDPRTLNVLSENLWIPAAMFASAMVFAAIV